MNAGASAPSIIQTYHHSTRAFAVRQCALGRARAHAVCLFRQSVYPHCLVVPRYALRTVLAASVLILLRCGGGDDESPAKKPGPDGGGDADSSAGGTGGVAGEAGKETGAGGSDAADAGGGEAGAAGAGGSLPTTAYDFMLWGQTDSARIWK